MEKKKTHKILISVLFLVAILLGYVVYNIYYDEKTNKKEIEIPEKQEMEEKKQSLSFMAVGDALIHDGVYKDAYTDNNNYDFNKMFTYFKDIVPNYDLAFYNQETIIGGKQLGLSSYPCFNSPDEIGNNLTDMGFNLVNLASNHTMDKGVKGAINSANFGSKKKMYMR